MGNLFIKIGAKKEEENKKNIFGSFIEIEKAHVKQHTTTSKTGKISQVKEYENKKIKKYSDSPNSTLKTAIRFVGKNNLKSSYESLRWSKRGGHAGDRKLYKVLQKVRDAKWKEYSGDSSNSADGEHVSNDTVYISPDKHFTITLHSHYGSTAYENSYSIEIKAKTKEANDAMNSLYKSQDDELQIQYFEDITKSHVRAHTRQTKSGKISNVRDYDDSRGYEQKDAMRIQGIIDRAKGNRNKEIALAEQMARSIASSAKAERRALAAEDENYHNVAEIFFNRAKELKRNKSVGTKEKVEVKENKKDEWEENKGKNTKEQEEKINENKKDEWEEKPTYKKEYSKGDMIYLKGVKDPVTVKLNHKKNSEYVHTSKGVFPVDHIDQLRIAEDETDEIIKEPKEKYNKLLDSWNKIIEKNSLNIPEALASFIKENELSKEDTRSFFELRSSNKGQKIK